jgi:hypothetical protein
VDMLPLLEQEAKERVGGRPKNDEKPTQKVGEVNEKSKHDGEAAS